MKHVVDVLGSLLLPTVAAFRVVGLIATSVPTANTAPFMSLGIGTPGSAWEAWSKRDVRL